MRISLLLAMLIASLACLSQENLYVAAKSGLSIREKPDAAAAVIGKIPYGMKITVTYPGDIVTINTEGIVGAWGKTTYAGKTGYIINSYLFPSPPPKAAVKNMKDYLGQLSPLFGSRLVVKSGAMDNPEEGGWEMRKQLFRNGAEWHEYLGYEYNSTAYFIPGFSMEQGFLLVRMIPEFREMWGEKDEFPTDSKVIKKGEIEYEIVVEKQQLGETIRYRQIRLEYAPGGVVFFEMYQIDNQLVIFTGSGV
jgi:hypothetical protein